MGGLCTGDGPCDPKPLGLGKNWVTKRGGLPLYVRAIANQFERNGASETSAIQLAIGAIKKWAAGGGKVKPETRARAAAALAQWNAMKGTSLSNVDLSFNPAEKRGVGGKWTAGSAAQKKAQANQMAKARSSYAMNAGKPGSASKSSGGGSGGSAAKKAANSALASGKPATKASTAKAAAINALPDDQRSALAGSTPPAGFKWSGNTLVPSGSGTSGGSSGSSSAASTAASKAATAASKQAASDAASAKPATKSSTARATAINSLSAADRTASAGKVPPAGFKWTTKGSPDGAPILVPSATNLSNGGSMFRRRRRKTEPTPQVPRIIELANGSMAERMFPDEAAVRKGCARLPKMTDPKLRTATRIMIKNRAEALGIDSSTLNLSVPMNLRAGARETAKKAGATLPGTTSYPTQTRPEFDKAVKAVGRGNASHKAIRAYLMRRAKAMGWTDGIPSNWAADGSLK